MSQGPGPETEVVQEPGEEGGWEDVGVGVTREEEKMEKQVERSGAKGLGMVGSEEKAGPRGKRREGNKVRCLSQAQQDWG